MLLEGWWYDSGGCIWCGGEKDGGIMPIRWREVVNEKECIFTMFESEASGGESDSGMWWHWWGLDEGPADVSSSVCIAGLTQDRVGIKMSIYSRYNTFHLAICGERRWAPEPVQCLEGQPLFRLAHLWMVHSDPSAVVLLSLPPLPLAALSLRPCFAFQPSVMLPVPLRVSGLHRSWASLRRLRCWVWCGCEAGCMPLEWNFQCQGE